MRTIEYTINAGIGDNLVIRIFFDRVKHDFHQIRISHNQHVLQVWRNGDPTYCKFLNELGALLFSDPPYVFEQRQHAAIDIVKTIKNLNLIPQKPNIDHLLCKGTSLNLDCEYIVLTTKIRFISKKMLYPIIPQLCRVLKELTKKYKIVILGERNVEKSKEYSHSSNTNMVYCIYEQIISNIPSDRIVDLTVPALGITVPDLKKIQQDCLIMKEAKGVITFGLGGNLWLALAVANTIGFRSGEGNISKEIAEFYATTDLVNNSQFPTAFLTKDWQTFIQRLSAL